ncbi:MAG: twin-arginine translocation signal domain-containing protein, partial [Brachybacterium tyrofermentans]
MTTLRSTPSRTTLQGAPRMSRHFASPSRRSLLAALGVGAGAAGLAACGSPNASGDNAE